jgi:murein DD-endopeptidase MepM/ murein hydrolase activator NlpD
VIHSKDEIGQRVTGVVERRPERAVSVDLGVEPPIEMDGGRHSALDRRRVSLRWLTGTVLTGLSGAALIGAAVYSALDRNPNFAEAPELVIHKDTATGDLVNPRKGDRLVKSVDIVAARQSYRAPTTIKVGDKEVIKWRGFARVSTTLTLASTGFADDVPPFNPLKVVADARNPVDQQSQDPGMMQDEAEVSFTTSDLSGTLTLPTAGYLSNEEVRAQVQEQVQNSVATGKNPAFEQSQLLLMRTSRASLDPTGGLSYATPGTSAISAPFSTMEVRMVPENVTLIPKSANVAGSDKQINQIEERLVVVRHGDTLEDILKANAATKDQIKSIVAAFGAKRGAAPVSEGQRLKLLLADLDENGGTMQLCRISVYTDEALQTTVAITDTGDYLQVAKVEAPEKPAARRKAADETDEEDNPGGMRLYDSLYETALKQEIPRPIIDDLVRIFANDIDFQRSVAGGDSFEAFYEEGDENEAHNDLLFASVTARGETYRYYRYQTPDDSLVDFYDPNGRSVRKFLLRKPIASGDLRSGFGMRYHPILHYAKMHTGVDWASPIGTPILAAGNGTVIKAAWDAGYGRRIEIQHANGYITTYNHMSGFARGVSEGIKVRQGQVVGYLGSSGLATGPHLHYEVMVNGRFVDPLQIRLPRTREFDGKLLADFRRERDRIDGLIAKAPNATAAHLAEKPPG